MTIAPADLTAGRAPLTAASSGQSARVALRRGEPVVLLDADVAEFAHAHRITLATNTYREVSAMRPVSSTQEDRR